MSEFELRTTKTFNRDIRLLDGQMKERLGRKIEQMRISGIPNDVDAVQCAPGCYRTKVGNHRLVFKIDGKRIDLVCFFHRKDDYRLLKRRVA